MLTDRERFEAVIERDYLDWWLRQAAAEHRARTPTDAAIDAATGVNDQRLEAVRDTLARITELNRLLGDAVGQP